MSRRCTVLGLDWPGVQDVDGLVGRLRCACGAVCLFRLRPLPTPFEVQGVGVLHDNQHAAAVWLVCHALLTGAADPIAEVADAQAVAPPD